MLCVVDPESEKWLADTEEKLALKLRAECLRLGSIMPYMPEGGVYHDMGAIALNTWTNGFYAGMLWQMYHASGDAYYREAAERIETRLDEALKKPAMLDHDVGFLWLLTAVADLRLTGNPLSRERGLRAACILAGRLQPSGSYIRAWNGEGKEGIAIVDTLMNLPLLYWAAEETGSDSFAIIAREHADTTLRYILRPDGSCCHMVRFDPETGRYLDSLGGQGYAKGSSWSRGQAWAMYGMALAYRYFGKTEYLDAAKRSAHYFIANAALNDYVPLIDFRAPADPYYIDTTAGVCAACALLEISEHVGDFEKPLYIRSALRCLNAADAHCDWDPERDAILGGGSARYDRASDRMVPLIYGDYFLTEAILRLQGKAFMIW